MMRAAIQTLSGRARIISRRTVIEYLSFWARIVLRRRKPLIVGITGSVGKTTTTEVVAAVLSHPRATPVVGTVWKTHGNMNDPVVLPLVVMGYEGWPKIDLRGILLLCTLPFRAIALATVRPYPRVLVLEFSISYEGEMRSRARLAQPTIAVVTAVGPAHLERYGTVERVAQEKGDLLVGVPASGLVILGSDNAYASAMDARTRAPVVKVPGRGRELSGGIARAIARYFGIGDDVVDAALEEFAGVGGRLQVLELGAITVVDDAFNANPLSMQLGLDTLAGQAPPGRRRVAILGHMAELGDQAPRYHEEIGSYARERADLTVGVGDLARRYAPDLWFPGSRECADSLHQFIRPGDYVLVKGSHSAHCDAVVAALKKLPVERAARELPVPG